MHQEIEPICIRLEKAAQLMDVSTSTLQTLSRTEPLLKPIQVGKGSARYVVAQLREYINTRPISDLAPPTNSGYGRRGLSAAQPT